MILKTQQAPRMGSFFRPVYDQIQNEFITSHTNAAKTTDLGRNKEKLKKLHKEELQEIEQLPEFVNSVNP